MERLSGDDYLLEKKLGEGHFAEVLLGRCKKNGSLIALKRIGKNKENPTVNKDSFRQEIKTATFLKNHPGVAKVLGHFETTRHYWLVMEFVEGMDLVKLMEQRDYRPISEKDCIPIFRQVVDALSYSHSKGVAHLDIKLDNILLQPDGTTKIIDWGLSCSEEPLLCKKVCGSPEYGAPELWNRNEDVHYNAFQSDVFSLGVTLYCLLVGQFPFDERTLYLMRNGFETDGYTIPTNVNLSLDAIDLLDCMFSPNPMDRITLKEIKNHPWLNRNNKIKIWAQL